MKKRLKELVYETYLHLRAYVILSIEAFKLRLAIGLSDIKQRARNRRFHVVLLRVGTDKRGMPIDRLRSICNDDFRRLKQSGLLPKRMSYLELSGKAFYSTPQSRNNTLSRDERDKAMKHYKRYVRSML